MNDWVLSRRLAIGHGLVASFVLPKVWRRSARAAAFGVPGAVAQPLVSHPLPARARRPLGPTVRPLVVLDPGHGGKDPGAIGISGTYEKHVALAAALELKRQLEGGGRYRVEVTRTGDVFIPLQLRVAFAQARGAAMFISMHADALGTPSVRGASIYTLAATASDEQTAQLARRENDADRFADPRWQNLSPTVAQILASLVRRETRIGSVHLAGDFVAQLNHDVPMLPNPARHAAFVVLKAADIPSVLVEMGFMSNPDDEAALRRPDHRARVAAAMRRAVDAYFAAAKPAARMAG